MFDLENRFRIRHRYRGCTIYAKPAKRGRKVSGEILVGKCRQWIPQQNSLEDMLRIAEWMIDRELDPPPSCIDDWFKRPLV